ncbi:hypothetical protein M569_06250, partial [Genlisea aurea]
NFDPIMDLLEEEECDTLIIYLPGFKKEEIKVQLTNTGILRITGSRSFSPNQRTTFHKHFPIPKNCDTPKISAKFVDGMLFVTLPKLQTDAASEKSSEQEKINKPELRSESSGQEKNPSDTTDEK